MKTILFAATLLFAGSVFAQVPSDLKSIQLCNLGHANETVEVSIDKLTLNIKATAGAQVQTLTSEIQKIIVATQGELSEIETKAKLKEKLSAAVVYNHVDGIDIIAKDTTGKKYLLQSIGTLVVLLATSDSCK